MNIIGISAFYHDSAAALVQDGKIIAACQEERFTRKKHDADFPAHAIKACLKIAQLSTQQIDSIIFFEKPFLKFERLIETYLSTAPMGWSSFKKAIPLWLKEKLFQKYYIQNKLKELNFSHTQTQSLLFSDHHLSHAASAFYPSPFDQALILTMDGVGEWATTSVCIGQGSKIKKIKEIHFPHSLGMLYSAFTAYCGFKVNSGEYKLMGLAPYGTPRYTDIIKKYLIHIQSDGSFALNMNYFDYCTGLFMINKNFENLFGLKTKKEEEPITQIHMDLAASIQAVLEEVLLKITRSLRQEFNIPNLVMAGGVALNCVANSKILEAKIFDDIWIQPASGDAGGALGAALIATHMHHNLPRIEQKNDLMQAAYLGTQYFSQEIKIALDEQKASYKIITEKDIFTQVAKDLDRGLTVGWFQGSMEFGPRALGARSILADPRKSEMQKKLNLQVKYRESFRPFAPAILEDDVNKYFELGCKSPYMLFVADIVKHRRKMISESEDKLFGIDKLNITRSDIPAVTHVDYSARVQTVNESNSPLFSALLKEFKKLTGCSVLVNTSFNVRGEPIVESPKDAFKCFMGTDIDRLVIGNFYLKKEDQLENLKKSYKDEFEKD